MDARYINPFMKSICNTFSTMCGIEVSVSKPVLKTTHDPSTDVSSVIGFSGGATGSVVLHFRFDVAAKVASAFAGIDIDPKHADFADALGELANMVAGGAKSQFEGLDISISLPSVIVGRDHSVFGTRVTKRLVIPCDTDCGDFYVEVGMIIEKPTDATPKPQVAAGASQ